MANPDRSPQKDPGMVRGIPNVHSPVNGIPSGRNVEIPTEPFLPDNFVVRPSKRVIVPIKNFWVPGAGSALTADITRREVIDRDIAKLNLKEQALNHGLVISGRGQRRITDDSDREQTRAGIDAFEKKIRARIARLNKQLDPESYKVTGETNHL